MYAFEEENIFFSEDFDESESKSLDEDSFSNELYLVSNKNVDNILKSVRKIVKFFKYSTIRSNILKKHISETGKKQQKLLLDVPHNGIQRAQ